MAGRSRQKSEDQRIALVRALARWMEPFGLLVAQLAYEMELGPEMGYRFLRP